MLTGIFGIFSQRLTQFVAQIKEENGYNDDDNTHHGNNNHKPKNLKQTFRRHSTDLPHIIENDRPTDVYVDTIYEHYNTPIRRTETGSQLRTLESPTKQKPKPLLPERKNKHEPFRIDPFTKDPLTTISATGKANEQRQPRPPLH